MFSSSMSATLLLFLFISFTPAHLTQCTPDDSNKLKFVAQLNVSGCAIFVHDTGAPDGPHLAVEPLMCVTESLDNLIPRYDMITGQTYVSVAVMMRDTTVLEEVQRQLRHLSPKSVKFARVGDIRVISYNSSNIQDVRFLWNPDQSVGFMRLICWNSIPYNPLGCGISQCIDKNNSRLLSAHKLASSINQQKLSASYQINGTMTQLNYQLMVQNYSFINPYIYTTRYTCLKSCNHMRFIRSIRLSNCSARVHQILDMKGHFVVEPLLCHNITSMSNDSIMYDHSKDLHYLKLDIVLQDDAIIDNIRSQLSDMSPRNITFMQLWNAQISVSSVLSARYEISQLMVSLDGKIGSLLVYCKSAMLCDSLISGLKFQPENFWWQIRVQIIFVTTRNCFIKADPSVFHGVFNELSMEPSNAELLVKFNTTCHDIKRLTRFIDGRTYVIIQQRLKGSVSFQRNWNEYEAGFGDETDFWIGLTKIHSLSKNGVTLRLEMKLWNGTQQHAEYAGFQVGDASTNYRMTYTDILRYRSNVTFDALAKHNIRGMQFSTKDRDNDGWIGDSCSNSHGGGGGWWFQFCKNFNPNGIYGNRNSHNIVWSYVFLREVRLMVEI